ncbi:MAG: aminopeptidase P family N-terminal domain-containing protein, partial [Alphaproteobacteria bacterium]|nr:aminopeptidase P family N-terminal domain-containing protein [Alphaproteobacteria bacterium]
MSTHTQRLVALRAELARQKLDGFVVPLTDAHMSEYVGEDAKRLEWLTGFGGSAGTAVVLADTAAMFVDGRYTLQVRDQVSGDDYAFENVPATSAAAWLGVHAPEGARIGYDPWLATRGWVKAAGEALAKRGSELVAVERNPIDAIWVDRPATSVAPAVVHPDEFAGQSSAEKRANIAAWLQEKQADTCVLAALDSIAWCFNIRGSDVSHTPVVLAFALIHADASADLFIAPGKVDEHISAHLGANVHLHPYDSFTTALNALSGKRVCVDPTSSVAAIFDALTGALIIEARDPCVLP